MDWLGAESRKKGTYSGPATNGTNRPNQVRATACLLAEWVEPRPGLEPGTCRLRIGCSTN